MGEMGDRERDRSKDRARRDRPGRPADGGGRDRSPDRDRDRRSTKSSNCRVYVSNIPYECRWQDLKDIFRSEVGDVQFVELFVDDNDKIKGTGIVEFSDQQSVKKCLEVMQGYEIRNRKLVIKDDSGNTRDKNGRLMSGNRRGRDEGRLGGGDRYGGSQMSLSGGRSGLDGNKWGNTYGLSPSFLDSLHIDVPLCNRVFVANLEYNVDKKKLKDIFRLSGKVQRVELHTDKDGRSRGFAVVEYDHPVEAVQAISMFHNQILYDRAMTVRMDRAAEHLKLPEGLKGIGMGLGVNGEPLRDVARNLPSNNTTGQDSGVLNSVNNSALQVASALSGLNGSGLGNLATTPSVLQAASLSNLIGNRLGTDLGIGSNLSTNSLVQNQSQLAALAAVGSQGLSNSSNAANISGFGRNDTSQDVYGSTQSTGYGSGQGFGSSRGGYSDLKSSGYSSDGYFKSPATASKSGGYSNKVLITNLPPSASYKLLLEKFNEFGEVQHLEEKGSGNMLIIYGSDWNAERAIKSLDRSRIDGRTIDARPYY